jgi:6-pyruvoyltetrahydropterin/6-carboxytetrahydropterin synthase
MYFVEKRIEVSASHNLCLDYESKCQKVHGHNFIITVYCKSNILNSNGMVVDFTKIKEEVMFADHDHLNDIFDFNPTAENIAEYLCNKIPKCYRVDVQESEGNIATYIKDEK